VQEKKGGMSAEGGSHHRKATLFQSVEGRVNEKEDSDLGGRRKGKGQKQQQKK